MVCWSCLTHVCENRINCTRFFLAPSSATSLWKLEIGHGGSIYTIEIVKYYQSDFCPTPSSPKELVIKQLPAALVKAILKREGYL